MAELIAGLIDVFADAPLTGNPLAVVQNADGLSREQMRRIAGEFNQAETTFILQSTRADRKLRLLDPLEDVAPLAQSLGLYEIDILSEPKPRPADTGAAHLMVRVLNTGTVDRARPQADRLLAVLKQAQAEGCYIYAFDDHAPETAFARFFNPTVGLSEDAATGTAAGPLAAYLASEGRLKNNELAIEQGTKMGRRSILRVRITPDPELSGAGIVVLRGLIRL